MSKTRRDTWYKKKLEQKYEKSWETEIYPLTRIRVFTFLAFYHLQSAVVRDLFYTCASQRYGNNVWRVIS